MRRILRNERWLRDGSQRDWRQVLNHSALDSPVERNFRSGLVRFSDQADLVLGTEPSSTTAPDTPARIIHREPVSGRPILDLKLPLQLNIQSSISSYVSTFSALTGGLLVGLDWTNVCVAGGIALAALLCIDIAADGDKYKSSDVDMYIYGLGPVEANKKVEHIYEVWRSNLKPSADGSTPQTGVLRNSRTTT